VAIKCLVINSLLLPKGKSTGQQHPLQSRRLCCRIPSEGLMSELQALCQI
jgi:hypothetical protein